MKLFGDILTNPFRDAFKIKIGLNIRDIFKVSIGSDNPGSRQKSNSHQHQANSNNTQPAVGGFYPLRLDDADRQAALERLAAIDEPWAQSIRGQIQER